MPTQTLAEAQEQVLTHLARGLKVEDAMAKVGRQRKTYENWRAAKDSDFAARADAARDRFKRGGDAAKEEGLKDLTFAEWRKRFLRRETYPHMQNLVDVLEGREPSWLHPSMDWHPASPHRAVVNIPPFHAKSQTITVDWVLYKLCMNPNLRFIIVSKKQTFAAKFLWQIKNRMESPLFAELQAAYGPDPERGFKGDVWSATQIYVAGRDSDEKDPNVEAVGMGGQIYGSRADYIILDDCIVKGNAQQFENQIDWIQAEVESRVKGGMIALVGTRLNTQDLYSEIIRGDRYLSGRSPWSYLRMPMVLEYKERPDEWVTLWPRTHTPLEQDDPTLVQGDDGMYPAWDGKAAHEKQQGNPPKTWETVYQQRSGGAETIFHPACVWGSVQGRRKPGPLRAGAVGHPPNGAEGMRIYGSIDPAGTGQAFILIYAVDRSTRKRYVLNAFTGDRTRPSWYLEKMRALTPEYRIDEWVIEQNAYASWLIHDEGIRDWSNSHGIKITPHFTGRNKQDPDYGVASMSGLFGGLRVKENGDEIHDGTNLIELPDPGKGPGVQALIEQLLVWEPGVSGAKLRQDGPMSLWFAELRARTFITGFKPTQQTHSNHRFVTPRSRRHRGVLRAG